METLQQRIERVTREDVAIVPYDPAWPESFRREKEHLLASLPTDLVRRIEHFGSTAVPGLAAKPVIDILVEVTDLEATRARIAPVLEAQGYDYFWRPTSGDEGPPFYAWFIKRGAGTRTHHVHMVEREFTQHWDRLLFRDYLIEHPDIARDYEELKRSLSSRFPSDRVAYTEGKTEFIVKVTEAAKQYYGGRGSVRAPCPEIGRLVVLGASNVTSGLSTIVATARGAWGPSVEVMAALGHGRSYGARSRFVARTLPGILQSGLWQELDRRPPLATRGLITDVGNDILYGFSAAQILAWVGEALDRVQRFTRDIVLTDLPMANIRRLSRAKYLLFRSVLVPSCRLSLGQVLEAAEHVSAGLARMSAARGVTFVPLDPAWYGFDPIHIRPSFRRPAWRDILGVRLAASVARPSMSERLGLYLLPAERQWLLGVERFCPQSGVALRSGSRVWLY
jgi:GrpB-like predicted nucleotidyltransferase (UPF0157 family)